MYTINRKLDHRPLDLKRGSACHHPRCLRRLRPHLPRQNHHHRRLQQLYYPHPQPNTQDKNEIKEGLKPVASSPLSNFTSLAAWYQQKNFQHIFLLSSSPLFSRNNNKKSYFLNVPQETVRAPCDVGPGRHSLSRAPRACRSRKLRT